MSRTRATLSNITGATLVRFETADGLTQNIDSEEAGRRIDHGRINFRAMAGVSGDDVVPYLYRLLSLDPHRFVFDLPSSMTTNGAVSSGSREGFVFQRGAGGKADGRPVGKVIFLSYDRKFVERDPGDREDFEAMR